MKATLLALALAAACGGPSKATKNPDNTATATDCGEGSGTMGPPSAGHAGSGQIAPSGSGDAGSGGGAPEPVDETGELGTQRLPMGPDAPPCHGKPATTSPSPVPPTPPPPAP
jgi:hypothetical protein